MQGLARCLKPLNLVHRMQAACKQEEEETWLGSYRNTLNSQTLL